MVLFAKLPRKGLKLGHLNIRSLRNKVIDISNILLEGHLHILGITETHLDSTFEDSLLHIVMTGFAVLLGSLCLSVFMVAVCLSVLVLQVEL